MSCIFCDIIEKKTAADIIDEDADIIIFKDIHPSAPVHLLVVPKKHIASIKDANAKDKELLGALLLKARDTAKNKGMEGYKLLFNVGRSGGQLVDHLHLHLMGGWDMDNSDKNK